MPTTLEHRLETLAREALARIDREAKEKAAPLIAMLIELEASKPPRPFLIDPVRSIANPLQWFSADPEHAPAAPSSSDTPSTDPSAPDDASALQRGVSERLARGALRSVADDMTRRGNSHDSRLGDALRYVARDASADDMARLHRLLK